MNAYFIFPDHCETRAIPSQTLGVSLWATSLANAITSDVSSSRDRALQLGLHIWRTDVIVHQAGLDPRHLTL